jgi:hypothetical protein
MAKKRAAAAAGAVSAAKDNPYVQRIVEDDELRDNVRVAFEAAKSAYERLSSAKAPSKQLMDDKKLHKDLKEAAEALRGAGSALRSAPQKKRRKGSLGRKLLVLVVGAGAAIALSSDLRSKVLDALFGKEEEFDYTSTTSPASSPAAEPVSSS